MKKLLIVILVILILILVAAFLLLGVRPAVKTLQIASDLKVPPGFQIEVLTSSLGENLASTPGPDNGPRMMMLQGNTLFVTIPSQGKVLTIDLDNPDKRTNFITGLNYPHS